MRYFVTGKGGVGKSTVSSALAVFLSQRGKTLLISLDPTQSLSTIFQQPIGEQEAPIRENLYIKEIDSLRYAERFKEKLKSRIARLNLSVNFDLDNYLNSVLANPATREEVLVEYIVDEILRPDYTYFVFDMAPSGSFFKTFSLLFALKSWIQFLRQQREKIAQLQAVVLQRKDDPILKELEGLLEKFESIRTVLLQEDTRFLVVCNPGIVSAKETLSQMEFFEKLHLHLKGIVLNKATGKNSWWEPLVNYGIELNEEHVRRYPQIVLPLLPQEPIGWDALKDLARELGKQLVAEKIV